MEFIKKSNYKQLELESSITYWVRPRLSIVLHNKDKELLESLQSKKKIFGGVGKITKHSEESIQSSTIGKRFWINFFTFIKYPLLTQNKQIFCY